MAKVLSLHGQEIVKAAFPNRALPRISYGLQYPDPIKNHVDSTLKAERVYLLVSKSLASTTDVLSLVEASLGTKLVGRWIGMRPHTLWSELCNIIESVRPLNIDVILTI